MLEKIKAELPQRIKEQNLYIVACPADKLPQNLIDQLVQKSKQEHVAQLDSTGGSQRFKDDQSYKKWANGKDRIVYLLMSPSAPEPEVAGIVWFGAKSHELLDDKYNITFAIRLYKDFLGKGLSGPFMQATHADVSRYYPGGFIWLETDDDNIPARKAYESLGYQLADSLDNRLIMVYPNEL